MPKIDPDGFKHDIIIDFEVFCTTLLGKIKMENFVKFVKIRFTIINFFV